MTYQFDRTDDAIIINDINPFVIGTDAMNLPGAWSDAQSFSYYDNDVNSALLFGKLYNYYSVNDPRNVCPDGCNRQDNISRN